MSTAEVVVFAAADGVTTPISCLERLGTSIRSSALATSRLTGTTLESVAVGLVDPYWSCFATTMARADLQGRLVPPFVDRGHDECPFLVLPS
jgi:hypothetical protein